MTDCIKKRQSHETLNRLFLIIYVDVVPTKKIPEVEKRGPPIYASGARQKLLFKHNEGF